MITNETWNTFLYAVAIAGKGMLGIFFFMAVFYLLIKLLDAVFPKKPEREKSE